MTKTYCGKRFGETVKVTVNGTPLKPCYELRQISQSGFEWGYNGAGPMQLALAILADHDSNTRALKDFRRFCELVVAEFDQNSWSLKAQDIDHYLDDTTDLPLTLKQLFSKVRGEG